MSLHSVKHFLAQHAPDLEVIELAESTATVALAAAAHGVEPGQIAKTLSLRMKEGIVLVVTRGDARLDNKKFKAHFGATARMLGADEVEALTGHPVGGAINAAVRICPERMATLTGAQWVDVAQAPA